MGEKLIKPYEISVWEDRLTQIEGSSPAQYEFKEQKIAVIGSDTMTGLNKAYNPVFHKKANGEKTLEFSMKYKYFDPYTNNDGVINPFVALLTNERKVKLHYGGKWYEFIVKDHNESSDEYTWTYTCNDASVIELSKNGYNIVFDSELGNNQGTAEELGERTLKDTEWKIGEGDLLRQLVAEPIYIGTVTKSFDAYNTDSRSDKLTTFDVGAELYIFYSYIKNKDGKFLQFIKKEDKALYTIDDNNVITATNYRILNDVVIEDTEIKQNNETIITLGEIETAFQANRLAYKQQNTYDPVLEKVVDVYKVQPADGETIEETTVYKYTDYTYTTSNVVLNFITNGENFNVLEDGTLQGWNPYVDFTKQSADDKIDKLELVTKPELTTGKELADLITLSQVEGFLKAQFKGPLVDHKENAIFNSGIENHTSFIESIAVDDKFVFRWRAGQGTIDSLTPYQNLRLLVASFTRDDPNPYTYYYRHIEPDNIILEFGAEEEKPKQLNNYVRGGRLVEEQKEQDGQLIGNTVYNYVIDNIVQIPSTKYIYVSVDPEHPEGEEIEYIWDGLTGKFIPKDESNYLPYYYLTAKAKKPISNTDLTDPNKHFGIFIYTTDGASPIYIQDIQLTRFVPDSTDETGETPILIGNVPTATSNAKEYYYIKPSDGSAAEDIIKYATPESLLSSLSSQGSIVPVYNENSEKFLSINESQSNCFNILQTIAETFECWVDLVVDHDDEGYITYAEDGSPNKFVYFREYAGKDNWAGFKYGVNLKSIERDVNSEEIVTKLIVDLSQSDYADDGFVTIANAHSNQSGEAYILNFDYYYSQGLLDREKAEKDRIAFIGELAEKNTELRELEKKRNDLEAALLKVGSNRNTYTELVASAQDLLTEGLGDFKNLTNRSYQEYQALQKDSETFDDKYYFETKDETVVDKKKYYIKETEAESGKTVMKEATGLNVGEAFPAGTYYELLLDLTKEETVIDTIGQIYINSAAINNYSGYVSNIEQEYWKLRRQLKGSEDYYVTIWIVVDKQNQRHLYVELNDYLPGFSFTINGSDSVYRSTVNKKFFDIITSSTVITFTAPSSHTMAQTEYTITPKVEQGDVATLKITANEEELGVEDQIEELQKEKDEITKAFNAKYRRFIQEGTWNSTDYIDSELYYLDALQTSITSAQPTVSYTINVVDISELEGFEWYLFDAGDKTYVEDTEFFGWHKTNVGDENNPDYVLTPAREEVIVSEVEWHLDKPDENVITVQNYKTRFEDFFQRISATVQTVQYNEATYAKISTLLDANGTINQDVFRQTVNNLSGKEYNLVSNGSIIKQDDAILVQNLQNSANRVIIKSDGIKVSSDGGNSWSPAIDGQGINLGVVYTGTLNTNQVIIGNKEKPSFRWDKAGISAFKSNGDEAYDLQTYVRYDQYGLYGIKDGEKFEAQNLQEVLDKAHFAVTWDGFFIKNSYEGGGQVEITTDNDFRVLKSGGIEKIKIGALEWDDANGNTTIDPTQGVGAPTLYGIRIKNDAGAEVMKTDDEGNITITGTINANAGIFDGLVKVGNSNPYIAIDGRDATISSSNYDNGAGSGWLIDSTGDAYFNNITARGAIKTAVFEYAEIQAVGGVFLFRPSSTIRSAAVSNDDLVLTVEKPILFKDGQWCKISNYASGSGTTDGEAVDPDVSNILLTNGLTHVYQVSRTPGSNNITLLRAAAMVGSGGVVENASELVGGALVDMGNKAGTSNYGIGVNSSDNTVNLPARAISLFETTIDETKEPKVTYNYRGILGTLPTMNTGVDTSIYQNMQGTQGIYTDNMYIGDEGQFIAFYEDDQGHKQLRIKANQVVYEVTDEHGQGTGVYQDVNQIEAEGVPGEDAIQVIIDSTAGNMFLRKNINTTLVCSVYKGTTDITNRVTRFTWTKKDKDGNTDSSWVQPVGTTNSIVIGPSDVASKAIFTCEVEF